MQKHDEDMGGIGKKNMGGVIGHGIGGKHIQTKMARLAKSQMLG